MNDTQQPDPDDPFAEHIRDNQEFRRLAEAEPVQDIVGVVGAGGAGGVETKGDPPPRLVFEFSHWRRAGSGVTSQALRCEMLSSDAQIEELMARMDPYQVVGIRARLARHPQGDLRALVTSVGGAVQGDEELDVLARKQQEPVVVSHPVFGDLTLDRRVDTFSGRVQWAGHEVELSLPGEDSDDLAAAMKHAEALWSEARNWHARACSRAVGKLLDLKNGEWLEDGETRLDAAGFVDRMTLKAIEVSEEGDLEFWFDDGDLFWGHVIQVSGSLSEGLTDADICG